MGDKATLAKARKELEDLYLGVPDDSVNLTFQDLAEVKQLRHTTSSEKKRSHPLMDPITESTPKREFPHNSPHLAKTPSLDFSRGLQAAASNYHHHNSTINQGNHNMYPHMSHDDHQRPSGEKAAGAKCGRPAPGEHSIGRKGSPDGGRARGGRQHRPVQDHHGYGHGHGHHGSSRHGGMVESSMAYDDDMSVMSGMSTASSMNPFGDRTGRRRPGIPHSNICTICCVYIYMFRTRCLVCGRVYCRQCVNIGMGEMNEGRKCIDCLGRKFSQRYIQRAGNVGCWASCCLRYPSTVTLQELKWAEKGPRRSGESRYVRSGMMSASRGPITPRTPTRAFVNSSPPSFVATSPYSPSHHHLPL